MWRYTSDRLQCVEPGIEADVSSVTFVQGCFAWNRLKCHCRPCSVSMRFLNPMWRLWRANLADLLLLVHNTGWHARLRLSVWRCCSAAQRLALLRQERERETEKEKERVRAQTIESAYARPHMYGLATRATFFLAN